MTERELRRSAVDAALAWLGTREGTAEHRRLVACYNAIRPLPAGYALRESDPWCAAFVSVAAAGAGLTGLIFPECSCPRMAALYRAAGRWEEVDFAVPKPGDVVFYDWDGDRVSDHVGLVTALEGEVLTVVEGNKSNAVGLRKISLDSPYICGYGQPAYAAAAEDGPLPERGPAATPAQPAETPAADVTLSLPTLASGCTGETVRAAQLLLIGRGCRCGPCGADGDFGPGTKGGVLSYQRGHRLAADGVIGPETWASLLGLGVSA